MAAVYPPSCCPRKGLRALKLDGGRNRIRAKRNREDIALAAIPARRIAAPTYITDSRRGNWSRPLMHLGRGEGHPVR
eukprot:5929154-Pyramimonas_sp.AAC.1